MGGNVDIYDSIEKSIKSKGRSVGDYVKSPFKVVKAVSKGDFKGALNETVKPYINEATRSINDTRERIADVSGLTAQQEAIAAEKEAAAQDNLAAIDLAGKQRQQTLANSASSKGAAVRLGTPSSSLGITRNTGVQS